MPFGGAIHSHPDATFIRGWMRADADERVQKEIYKRLESLQVGVNPLIDTQQVFSNVRRQLKPD